MSCWFVGLTLPLECLRDLGIEEACRKVATPIQKVPYHRLCTSMAGEEMSRAFAYENDPRRRVSETLAIHFQLAFVFCSILIGRSRRSKSL